MLGYYGEYVHEIIPVNDGSNDRTGEVIAKLAENDKRVKPLHRIPPNGVGLAIADGLAAASGRYALTMDCDFQHLLPEFRDLLDQVAEGYDVVIGSRFSRHSVLLNYPFLKIFANRAFHTLAMVLFRMRIRDVTNNLKIMRRGVVADLRLRQPGFAVNAETGLQPLLLGYEISRRCLFRRSTDRREWAARPSASCEWAAVIGRCLAGSGFGMLWGLDHIGHSRDIMLVLDLAARRLHAARPARISSCRQFEHRTFLAGSPQVMVILRIKRALDLICAGLLLVLWLLVWIPRLKGPIDLRWDASTYYVLGTALSEGRGYRLLNEPGNIEAAQYPPLLPLIVAAHQRLMGTTDYVRVGSALRITYFLTSGLFVLAAYALVRKLVSPLYALLIVASATLSFYSFIHPSDILYAEMPFALVSTLFLLCHKSSDGPFRSVALGCFGSAAYLLRFAGIALLFSLDNRKPDSPSRRRVRNSNGRFRDSDSNLASPRWACNQK